MKEAGETAKFLVRNLDPSPQIEILAKSVDIQEVLEEIDDHTYAYRYYDENPIGIYKKIVPKFMKTLK